MKNIAENSLSDYKFKEYFTSRIAQVSYQKELKTIVSKLTSEYVPIEHFKDTFLKISELVEAGYNYKFIFDKRALKAFHQPSMEWYFVVWKKEMYEKELRIHRKILPPEPWFQKSMESAKAQIYREHQDLVAAQLDIKYCESVEEAIES